MLWYEDDISVTLLRRTLAFFPSPNALIADRKGMWAVCSNRNLQFLIEGAG